MALEKTWRWFGEKDSVTLSELKQMGVEGVVTSLHHIPTGEIWPGEEIARIRDLIASFGMRWSVVESLPVSEAIKTASADRSRHIDNYRASLRNLGECGIDTVCYNFMPVLDWARTDLHYRLDSGAESMLFDYATFAAFDIHILKRPGAAGDYPEDTIAKAAGIFERMSPERREELAHNIIVATQAFINGTVGDSSDYKEAFLQYLATYSDITPDVLRSNLGSFLRDVVPAAEESGVRLCIHPDDPPFPLLGLPRIAGTLDDFMWILRQHDSVANGITLCTGSLSASPDNDLVEMARKLAGRIHFVHLRNTQRLGFKSFYESGHLNGSADIYGVMRELLLEQRRRIASGRKDFRLPVRSDHGLTILDDFSRKSNPGYPLIGRMKGLAEISGLERGVELSLDERTDPVPDAETLAPA